MDLDNIADIIYAKSRKFERHVQFLRKGWEDSLRNAGKKITLIDIQERLKLGSLSDEFLFNFKEGDEIRTGISVENRNGYAVYITRDKLAINYNGVILREFTGTRVNSYYDKLSKIILEEQDDKLRNLPF